MSTAMASICVSAPLARADSTDIKRQKTVQDRFWLLPPCHVGHGARQSQGSEHAASPGHQSSGSPRRTTGAGPARQDQYLRADVPRLAQKCDPKQLGQLLRDIRGYNGNFITIAALRLAPLVFQRPGQLRLAHWEGIDLKKKLWQCPPENMKLREWQKRDNRTPAQIVPLSRQARRVLENLLPITGPSGPVFPNMARRSDK